MRHALIILMLPITLLLSGCCWWSDDEQRPYHEVRMENRTDQTVSIRYTAVTHVFRSTDDEGNDTYSYQYADRKIDLGAGTHSDLQVPLRSEVEIKADYNHIIHWFRKDADGGCPEALTITMEIDDFVPAMPAANG